MPAAIELDQLGKDWTGVARQRLHLRQNGIGFDCVVFAICHRIELLPRQPGHATILVPGALGELSQPVGCANARRGRHARPRVLGSECDLDKQTFLADRIDRAAATLHIGSAARNIGTDRIGT